MQVSRNNIPSNQMPVHLCKWSEEFSPIRCVCSPLCWVQLCPRLGVLLYKCMTCFQMPRIPVCRKHNTGHAGHLVSINIAALHVLLCELSQAFYMFWWEFHFWDPTSLWDLGHGLMLQRSPVSIVSWKAGSVRSIFFLVALTKKYEMQAVS